jgi:hypothetical protein
MAGTLEALTKKAPLHCGRGFEVFRSGAIPSAGDWFHKEKRAAGVVWVRRLVLASRGLTGLLNPCVKFGTKLFQPYFINCFNCASPSVPV